MHSTYINKHAQTHLSIFFKFSTYVPSENAKKPLSESGAVAGSWTVVATAACPVLSADLRVLWLCALQPQDVEEDVADGQGLLVVSPFQTVVEQVITVTMRSKTSERQK